MQSIVRALGLEHPCIQAPLKASQPPLHLDEQVWPQPVEYLLASQPHSSELSTLFINSFLFYFKFHNNGFLTIDSIIVVSYVAHKKKKALL